MPIKREGGHYQPTPNPDTAPQTPEVQQKNPFIEAGFESGDQILYRSNTEVPEHIMTLVITTFNDPRGRALLVPDGDVVQVWKNVHPDHCRIYKYPSIERAIDAYPTALSRTQSVVDIVHLFEVLERSGLPANHPALRITENWTEAKSLLEDAASLCKKPLDSERWKNIMCRFTRTAELRTHIVRVVEAEMKRQAAQDELLVSLRQLPIGGHVKVQGCVYRRIGPDGFHRDDPTTDERTTLIKRYTTLQIENLLRQDRISDVEIWSTTNLESINKDYWGGKIPAPFKNLLLPELYPSPIGVINKMAHALGQSVGLRRRNSYEDIVKALPRSTIHQGTMGDCYLLAGINSLKKTQPELYLYTLSQSVRKHPSTHEWQVLFQGIDLPRMQMSLGDDFDGWITVTENDLFQWKKQGAQADLPDLILERAYASYISRSRHRQVGITMKHDERSRIAFEGGFGHRALNDILGPAIVRKQMIANYETSDGEQSLKANGYAQTARQFLENAFVQHPKDYVVTANTFYTPESRVLITVNGHHIRARHAFSVIAVNHQGVFLEDPHDTSKSILMNMDLFLDTFSQISYVEIRRAKTR